MGHRGVGDERAHVVLLAACRVRHTGAARAWLPEMIGGELLGAYCLSEAHAGSDAAALSTRAVREGDDYVLTGTKAWITHAGVADFYTVMARTSDDGPRGISCFLVPADAAGLSFGALERKMGLWASPTRVVNLDGVRISADRRIGAEGEGFTIALAALDSGRLGISACATGLAQAALDAATSYAQQREQFGKPIIDHQGLGLPARGHDRGGRGCAGDVSCGSPAP